jgi:hypothetical protein
MSEESKIQWDDEIPDNYEVEFEPDEVEKVPPLARLQIDTRLCGSLKIVSEDGRYFATWYEHHPELGTFDEHFPPASHEEYLENHFNEEYLQEWRDLRERLPSKSFRREISRRDAYQIVASFWLPKEFHDLAGLS